MGMGRNRKSGRANWPANVYAAGGGYEYRNPETGKRTYLGRDQAAVFAAARKLNAMLIPRNDLVAKVIGHTETIKDAIALFRKEDMPGRDWAPKTIEIYESILNRMDAAIGERQVDGFSVRDCADFLRDVTASARARQQFRLALQWVLTCAVEVGWIESNPALQTRKANWKRARERLTLDVYNAIREKAAAWLQNAMDLSLHTLLRREDVCALRFEDVRDGALWVVPGKTEGSTGARLKLECAPDSDVAQLLASCRDSVVSPFLIHRLPERMAAHGKRAEGRTHHTQVLPEQLSRAFADAREAAGITSASPPTFHEIRSLGAALKHDKEGWTRQQVQDLLTHTDVGMTDLYLDGHAKPWTTVRLG
jgi:integrase